MHRFAHLSDVHVGAFRDPVLKNLVLETFNRAMDICVERKVDFIIVSGDLFDANVPDLEKASEAVAKLRALKDEGIGIYIVYGSHDFSPTHKSVVDLLDSAGLFLKVTKGKTLEDGRIRLEPVTDPKTGAKLVGMDGRKLGIDKQYFAALDRSPLEQLDGFRIFVFHGTLSEYKPSTYPDAESLPASSLPRGFDYYAAGHLHERTTGKLPGYEHIIYPGTLFGGDYGDLEKNARGMKRGLFIIDFDSKVKTTEFVPINLCKYCLIEYDANGRTAKKLEEDLLQRAKDCDASGSIVIMKVRGELSTGKTSDIDFARIARIIEERGAIHVSVSRSLSSREYTAVKVSGGDVRELETKLFRESIGQFKTNIPKLKGEAGVDLSVKLLTVLKQSRKEDEKKREYDSRIINDGANILGLEEAVPSS